MVLKKTKMVCTIGPASESPEMLRTLISEGMDVARLNFSHGDYDEHAKRVKDIRDAGREMKKTVGILLDLQGPEIRTTKFKDGIAELDRKSNTSELQSRGHLVCRLLLEKKKPGRGTG